MIETGYSWQHIIEEGEEWTTGLELWLLEMHAAVSFSICFVLPRYNITSIIPGPFVALMTCTFVENVNIDLVGGALSRILNYKGSTKTPLLRKNWVNDNINLPALELDTLRNIWMPALAVFGAGVHESLLTKQIIDELTEVKGDHGCVIVGQ